jgi:CO/xanthine dehydrogenase FAD-binding subunit
VEGGVAVKPAPFEYAAPRSLEEALALLGDEVTPLAGGQSLVPMLNFRLARPEKLVDLNGLNELDYLREEGGVLRIGAMTRQAALERSELVATRCPLLTDAVRHVGHPATRSRGTVGGSVTHSDPAGELPVAMAALDARFHLRSASGSRELGADEFFLGPLMTARTEDELLTEVEVPLPPDGARSAFAEYAGTQGDWAIAGAAVVVAPGGGASVALLAAGPTPLRAREAEAALANGATAAQAAALAARPVADDHRRALTAELVRQAIKSASE